MAIIKVKLKTDYQRKDGTYQVVIYAYEVRPQYIDTGVAVRKDQFQDKHDHWIKKHPDLVLLNQKIEDTRIRVRDGMVPGIGYVEGHTPDANNGNFCEYIRRRAVQFGNDHREDMRLKCNRMAYELSQVKGRDVFCVEITMDFIRSYYTWCSTARPDSRGVVQPANSNNTIMRKIKNLRTLYNQAMDDKMAPAPNPFNNFTIKLDKVRLKRYTKPQIGAIEALKLEPGTTIDHARNAFLFSFYCHGMRFEKVCTVKWSDVKNGYIEYENNKGSAARTVKIVPQLQAILDKYTGSTPYIFPFFKREVRDKLDLRNMKGSANATVNAFLKIVGDMAGLGNDMKFHWARHSFAYIAKKKGVSGAVISDALGHGDEAITRAYMDRLDDDHINDAMAGVYE